VLSLKAIENLSKNGQRKESILRLRNEPESSLERARELLTALNLLGCGCLDTSLMAHQRMGALLDQRDPSF